MLDAILLPFILNISPPNDFDDDLSETAEELQMLKQSSLCNGKHISWGIVKDNTDGVFQLRLTSR